MANILWKDLSEQSRKVYLNRIKTLGMLSGLFKDIKGVNGQKPYLHYRNHEILFIKSFGVNGITRKDSAFDAIATINNKNIGIGLKTWIHSSDKTNQKVAEFNKKSKELRELYESGKIKELVIKIAELRNERINDDKRLYETDLDIYHVITRDNNVAYVVECSYDLIDISTITNINSTDTSVTFEDSKNSYLYNLSKSTLFKKFIANEKEVIDRIEIEISDDPFVVLDKLWSELEVTKQVHNEQSIVLPLYNDETYKVNEKSVFNASLASPKNKGSNQPRPAYEAYAPIPKYIHILKPNFFGIDALDKEERQASKFDLHLPSGKVVQAKITQDSGKAIQTNPQSILGKWLLYNIFGLGEYEVLTREILDDKQIDSLVVTKIDDYNFKIDVGDYLAYEKWKLQHKEEILNLLSKGKITKRAVPKFREELLEEGSED